MKTHATLFIFLFSLFAATLAQGQDPSTINMAILGLGGRAHHVLEDCFALQKNIKVVAVCDDHGTESLNSFIKKLEDEKKDTTFAKDYKNIFSNTVFYADDEAGLKKLFEEHKNIHKVFVTSPNYSHYRHINAVLNYSACKDIYVEKPIVKNLDELEQLNLGTHHEGIAVGLTLRYSSMAKIVVEKLQEYQQRLSSLKTVKAWEHVRFCQALTSFMMNWRRYVSLSGGLLLEKCIHDLDLALFFINSLGIEPQNIHISTNTAHNLFKHSQKQMILDQISQNDELKKTLINRDKSSFQRLVDFTMNQDGSINWPMTINAIFEEIPKDDDLEGSNIIPDYHALRAVIQPKNGSALDLELEVILGSFRPTTARGMHFVFENGTVEIDVMKSCMTISLNDGSRHEVNLQTNNSDHADGDTYIARTILGMLSEGQYRATLTDPTVRLAMVMGLVSEHQALHKDQQAMHIKQLDGHWNVQERT